MSCVASVVLAGSTPAASLVAQTPAYEELQTFSAILNHVRLNYVDTVSYRSMVRAAIDGVLRSLDPHSYFVPKEAKDRRDELRAGTAAWCGIGLVRVEGDLVVLSVEPGGPAGRAGVMPGDRLVAIADTSTAGLSVDAAEVALIGPPRSTVALTLDRGSRFAPDRYRVEVQRAGPVQGAVRVARLLDHRTGFVRLSSFPSGAGEELERAVADLRNDGAEALILDLRGNPGGGLNAAIEVAALFLRGGAPVYRLRGRKADTVEDGIVPRGGPFVGMPLAILVDAYSASATEAVAGALQDHGAAILVGRRTFGKALAQSPFLLPNGDVVWLTIGHVFTPAGRSLQRQYRNRTPEAYREEAGADRVAGGAASPEEGQRGGVPPDVEVLDQGLPPAWWMEADRLGIPFAVADSVGATLEPTAEGRAEWMTNPARWSDALLPPLFAAVEAGIGEVPEPDASVRTVIARRLAGRAAAVRWGEEAGNELRLAHDPDILAALDALRR